MKYIITESRLESAIISYLDENFYPDYSWNKIEEYKRDLDKWGEIGFFIDDVESYTYYGCDARDEKHEDKYFEPNGHLYNFECPLLSIYPKVSQQLNDYFGDMWKPIFKNWFEENTGLIVNQITDAYI
jgi:hypothetical protein